MTNEQPSKAKGILATVVAGAVAVGAFILVQAAEQLGQMGGAWLSGGLFFPLVLIFLCCWIAKRLLPPALEDVRIAIGIVAGQASWFLIAALLAGGEVLAQVLPDVVILTAGLAWLITRPGVWPIIFLMAFEGLVLLLNLFMLTQVGVEEGLKGIISAVLIRVAALIFLYSGLQSRRAAARGVALADQSQAPAPPS